jgi:hypothetical protein
MVRKLLTGWQEIQETRRGCLAYIQPVEKGDSHKD